MKKFSKLAVVLMSTSLVLGAGSRARADLIQLSFSDLLAGYNTGGMSIETSSTLGGVKIPDSVPFTFSAWFDTTKRFTSPWGDDLYPMESFTMTIDKTVYTGIVTNTLNVMLSSPSVVGGYYGLGIADADGSGNWYNADTQPNAMIFIYSTATPSLNTAAPTPSVFTDPYFFCYSTYMNIPLVGVEGGLQLNNGPNGYAVTYPQYNPGVTASLSAIPEPGSLALIGLFGGASLLWRRIRGRRED